MLHAHPRIAIPPETRYLVDVYDRRLEFGDLRAPEQRRALGHAIAKTQGTKFRDLRLDPDLVIERIVEGPPTIGSAVGITLREYALRFGKPRWGDKRPGYWRHLGVLLSLFPDAQILHIVRDGRDCVSSLKRMPWWQQGVLAAMATWVQAMEVGRRAQHRLRPDQYHEIYYERLVADPRTELQSLCDFLSEDFDEAMLQPSSVASDAIPKRKRKSWHTRTKDTVSQAAVNQWTQQLTPEELALMETVARRQLQAHGYQLSGSATPHRSQLAAYWLLYARREAVAAKWLVADRGRALRYRRPVAAQLTSGQLARLG
ncbi:MAG: sulfotransferase [Actinomycetota bacterium]|nr:sulfotransferase [Actinomycetota bacterium]